MFTNLADEFNNCLITDHAAIVLGRFKNQGLITHYNTDNNYLTFIDGSKTIFSTYRVDIKLIKTRLNRYFFTSEKIYKIGDVISIPNSYDFKITRVIFEINSFAPGDLEETYEPVYRYYVEKI